MKRRQVKEGFLSLETFLYFISPGRPVENKFSLTTGTWPR
jgi:hypothetical protein